MSNIARWQRVETPVWPTFGRLFGLRRELDRLFETSFNEFTGDPAQALGVWSPAVDIHDTKDALVVKAELPGMKKEDIEISFHKGTLSISGERKAEEQFQNAEAYRSERFVGRFQRSIALPSPVNAGAISAQYKEGILIVSLPKTEESKPKQIQVNIA